MNSQVSIVGVKFSGDFPVIPPPINGPLSLSRLDLEKEGIDISSAILGGSQACSNGLLISGKGPYPWGYSIRIVTNKFLFSLLKEYKYVEIQHAKATAPVKGKIYRIPGLHWILFGEVKFSGR